MRFYFSIFKDQYLRTFFGLSFLALIFLTAIFLVKISGNQSLLILYSDALSGANFFGGKLDALGILIAAFFILLINFFLADFFYWRERLFSYLLGIGSLFLTVLILIAVGAIMAANL